MKKNINLKLYNNNKIQKEYKNIISIHKDNTYNMILDDVKTTLSENKFKRETEEYLFELDIKNKTALYTLKNNNLSFDIEVEKIMYNDTESNIILEYKISSEEGLLKILIEKGVNDE